MKVRVTYTVEVSDEYRRALASYYGGAGLATREEVQAHHRVNGTSLDDDVMYDYGQKMRRTRDDSLDEIVGEEVDDDEFDR